MNGDCLLISFCIWSYYKNKWIDVNIEHCAKCVHVEIPMYTVKGSKCMSEFQNLCIDCTVHEGNTYVMAFNGNKFDHIYFIDDFPLPYQSHLGKATSIKKVSWIVSNGYLLETRDLAEFITMMPLKDLAPKEYPKLDYDGDKFNLYNIDESIEYCCRDTWILQNCWFKTILPRFRPMIGVLFEHEIMIIKYFSQAHAAYQAALRSFCNSEIVKHLEGEMFWYIRGAYFGARVDSQIYGEEHLNVDNCFFDISSMYPAAMNNPMPFGDISFMKHMSIDYGMDFDFLLHKPFICTVIMDKKPQGCLQERYGLVPIRDKSGGIHYINSGHIEGVYSSVDIGCFIRDGWTIKGTMNYVLWDKWSMACGDFYREWYNIKQTQKKSNPNNYWAAKIILNSSIGKFCQKVFKGKDNTKPCQFGIFCLSYTRWLHYMMKDLCTRFEVPIIYYGDTDSICIDSDKMRMIELHCPDIFKLDYLGDYETLKGEAEWGNEGTKIVVLAKKLYHNGKKFACKGHRKDNMEYEVMSDTLKGIKQYSVMESPTKCVKILKGNKIWSNVSPFNESKRVIQVSIPLFRIKCTCCNYYVTNSIKQILIYKRVLLIE